MTPANVPMAEVQARHPEDRRFVALLTKLQPYGGMLTDDELRCLQTVCLPGFSLGEALLRRELVSLKWRHRLWLPLFQFQLPAWSPAWHVAVVVNELHPVLQGFELIEWFLTSNPWLRNERPIDRLDADPAQVLRAAQADRFLITF